MRTNILVPSRLQLCLSGDASSQLVLITAQLNQTVIDLSINNINSFFFSLIFIAGVRDHNLFRKNYWIVLLQVDVHSINVKTSLDKVRLLH